MYPFFLLLSLLLVGCDAAVKFSRSVIMDEYDLSAQKMVEMHKCLTKSCKIYVSAPESSYESLDNINCGESTLGAMARAVDLITGEKVPYFMERYSAKAFMKNLNANHTCDPVVVYIVREGASMYNSARVFEAKQAALNIHWTNEETITLLSAEPFTVSANMDGGSLNGSIYTTGYDNILGNEDHCAPVYEFSKGNAFKFSVTGPIATLYRESFGEVELTVTNKFEVITDSPTLITSNGYIGCRNGKSYQSSLYDPLVSYHLAYDKAYYVHISAYLNTLNDFVTIKVDGEEAASIKGAVGRLNWNQTLDVHGKEIDIRFEGTKPQFSSFLLRLWTGEEPVTYQTTSRRFTFSTKPFTGTTKSSQVETTSVRTSTRDVTTTSTSSAVTSFMFVIGCICLVNTM